MTAESYHLSHIKLLEAESIHIIREVVAEFENPVMLYSVGKDSSVMVHLALKAFAPGKVPFPLLHVDTNFKFPDMYSFRDSYCTEKCLDLRVFANQEAIDAGVNPIDLGTIKCCAELKTKGLLDALKAGGYDAAFGGARRDEEKSRAKERIYSFRDKFGQWDPKNQRPELWNLYNGRHKQGEHIRIFPLSNWTELDIWQYVADDEVELPSIYYAHQREVFERDGMLIAVNPFVTIADDEVVETRTVRFRTVGDASCTGAVESGATTVEEVILEVAAARITERGATRADDRISEAGMEDRKREGYF